MDLEDFKPTFDDVEVILYNGKGEDRTPILNPDGSEMEITLFSPHTKEYKKAKNTVVRNFIDQASETGKEDLEIDFEQIFPLITKSWNITYKKESPTLSVEKAKEIYENIPLILPQLDSGLNKAQDFT